MKVMIYKTVEQRIVEVGGHTSGFDYLRLILALSVIAWHTVLICYGRLAETPFWMGHIRPLLYVIIPAFFALSGFLVAMSMERVNRILPFATLRALRIFPALCVEVFISALLIGPMLTTVPLTDYFHDPRFYSYFKNLVGNIHYELPALFDYNRVNAVNLQLWTIPYELDVYIVAAIVMLIGLARSTIWCGIAALIFTIVASYADHITDRLILNARAPENLSICTFMWGAFLYLCRKKIPYNGLLCILCVATTWAAFSFAETSYAAAIPVAYITVYLGLLNPRKIFLISSGDFSYGLYLYGFPIQQMVSAMLPSYRVWYIHFPISLFIISICAYMSWTFVESVILGRKKQILAWVDRQAGKLAALVNSLAIPIASGDVRYRNSAE